MSEAQCSVCGEMQGATSALAASEAARKKIAADVGHRLASANAEYGRILGQYRDEHAAQLAAVADTVRGGGIARPFVPDVRWGWN